MKWRLFRKATLISFGVILGLGQYCANACVCVWAFGCVRVCVFCVYLAFLPFAFYVPNTLAVMENVSP